MQIVKYLGWSEWRQARRLTHSELSTLISSFRSTTLGLLCGNIGLALNIGNGPGSYETQAELITIFFPRTEARALISKRKTVFHRHLLLFLAREAMRVFRADKEESLPDISDHEVGHLCMKINDLLYTAREIPAAKSDLLVHHIVDFLPSLESNGFINPWLKFLRAHVMLWDIAMKGSNLQYDFGAVFERVVNVPLRQYEAILFGALTHGVERQMKRTKGNSPQCDMGMDWFASTIIDPQTIESFFTDVSATPAQFASYISQKKPPEGDFTLFRDKPFLRVGDRFVPIDFNFCIEKFESGPFWSIHNRLESDQEREVLHSFWGGVFEDYVNLLLEDSADGKKNVFRPNPVYADDHSDEVCDAIIKSGRTLILIESKGSTFRSTSKYGSSFRELKAELEKKVVAKSSKERKGVSQLAHAVNCLCRSQDTRTVSDLDTNDITTVIPLIVLRDDLGSSIGINAYLNLRFKELLGKHRYPISIKPLILLSADALGTLAPLLSYQSFADVCMSRIRKEKSLRLPFLVAYSPANLKGKRASLLVRATEQLFETAVTSLGMDVQSGVLSI